MGFYSGGCYSATIEAYLLVGDVRYPIAKTSHVDVVVAEPCELPPGCKAELVMIVDGDKSSRAIILYEGATRDSLSAPYFEAA